MENLSFSANRTSGEGHPLRLCRLVSTRHESVPWITPSLTLASGGGAQMGAFITNS